MIYKNIEAVWAFYTGMVGIAFIAIMTLIFIVFVWVINPIREYIKKQ